MSGTWNSAYRCSFSWDMATNGLSSSWTSPSASVLLPLSEVMPSYAVFTKTLPPEVWLEILSLCTFTPRFLETQPEDALTLEYAEDEIQATVKTRHSLLFVSRQFYGLARRFLYEFLFITRMRQLRALHNTLNLTSEFDNYHDPALYVKRFDFRCVDPNKALADEALPIPTFDKAHLVWMFDLVYRVACRSPNLSHFSCHLPMHINELKADSSMAVFDQNLQSFGWGGGLRFPLTAMLTSYPNICVLRLDRFDDMELDSERIAVEMPNLHTLHAPVSIIFSIFPTISLPSLSTVILARSLTRPSTSQFRPDTFFAAHGNKIRTLICPSSFALIKDHLHICTNLRSFIISADYIDHIPSHVSDRITHLGIYGDAMIINTTMNHWQTLWDYICDTIVGSFGHSFHHLTVLRIVDRRMALKLKENNPHGLRVWERRFRGNGIRLEDDKGQILLS